MDLTNVATDVDVAVVLAEDVISVHLFHSRFFPSFVRTIWEISLSHIATSTDQSLCLRIST
jgi:hypothetical protein